MASGFNELIDATMDFVREQFEKAGNQSVNIFWDYLSLLQNKGLDMGNDFAEFSSEVLDAMIEYQRAAISTAGIESKLKEINEFMLEFIKENKGKGNWNDFLNQLADKQLQLNNEYTQYVKRVIESVHKIYSYHIW
ncbi:MAG: hypothetical protein L7F77_16265 [Candidatus Magnetominusculus sp. LBB02]|nr:hypothetical protein [Candidatus Magnetominusculus sp. LBB02]